MESERRVNKSEPSKVAGDSSALVGRRRFVRGVGVIVPAVLTVGSRSALATVGCLSPSASASINLLHSRPNRPGGTCLGRTPGYWKNACDNHLSCIARNQQFNIVYSGGWSQTMEQVCGLEGNANYAALGRHLAAAWCNYAAGLVPTSILSLETLKAMWAGRAGTYSPTSGVTWTADQIVIYLLTTMPL